MLLEKNYDVSDIKHVVLTEVAKLAFESTSDTEWENSLESLPYKLIPGPLANFRCCIYKEREIIRQRVRLAQGKSPSADLDNKNIVQVINSACEDCPITRFTITDNCQKCMSKKCQTACNFDAISMTATRAYIDPSLCKECGKCANACPYHAIADLIRPCKKSCPVDAITMDQYNIVKIDEDKCINCAACIKDCPFGAISDRSFILDVIKLIKQNTPIYAMVAPAGEGQFGKDVTMGMLAKGIKKLGFTDMYEVALGADYTATSEAEEWLEAYGEGEKKTTSCCPAFVNMIKKHFPQLVSSISTTISPMAATAKLIKQMHPGAVTVFIGPCIAKKGEVLDSITLDAADYALTFEELVAMFKAQDIDLTAFDGDMQNGSIYGKRFANAGGVTAAVIEAMREKDVEADIKVRQCNGAQECKKALMLFKSGRLPEDFIEGMCCEGGCVNGPSSVLTGSKAIKARESLLINADDRGIHKNIDQYNNYSFSMHHSQD